MPPPKNNQPRVDATILQLWQEGWTVERIARRLADANQTSPDSQLPHIVSVLEKNSINWRVRKSPAVLDGNKLSWENRRAYKESRGITLRQAKAIQQRLPSYSEEEAEGEQRRLEGGQP